VIILLRAGDVVADEPLAEGRGEVESLLAGVWEYAAGEVGLGEGELRGASGAGGAGKGLFGVVDAWPAALVDELPPAQLFGDLALYELLFFLDVAVARVAAQGWLVGPWPGDFDFAGFLKESSADDLSDRFTVMGRFARGESKPRPHT